MLTNDKVALNVRADESVRNLIDQAASLVNKDRTSFILGTMRRESENLILDQCIFKVDQEAFEKLDSLLNSPILDNPALMSLLKPTSPWDK